MFDYEKDIAPIKGWLTKREASFLYDQALRVPSSRVIVEIGSWKGKSTVCLALGSRDGFRARVLAIDPHVGSSEHQRWYGTIDTFLDFKKTLKASRLTSFVYPYRMTSFEASKIIYKRVGLVFIDGAHEYSFVKLDADLWIPRVVSGGFIIFHDSFHLIGVNLLTAKLLFTSRCLRRPKLCDTFTILEKTERVTFFERLYNIGFFFYRTFLGGWVGFFRIKLSGCSQCKRRVGF